MTVGAGLDIPHLTEHVGVDAHGDLLVGAARDETPGLRVGTDNGTSGLLLGMMISYRFGTAWAAQGGYQLQFLKTDFKGQSERLQSGSFATRSDTDHIVLLGLSYSR